MKTKLLFFLLLAMLFQVRSSAYTQEQLTKRQIELRTKSKDTRRSVPIPPLAFIEGQLISIEFPLTMPSVTVVISNAETGEVVYSDTGFDANEIIINLGGEDPGIYIIEISTPTTTSMGEFEL